MTRAAPSAADIEAQIRAFLVQSNPDRGDELLALANDVPLWDVVGSLNLLELADYLEACFDIDIEPLHFAQENFRSVDSVRRLVQRHLVTPAGVTPAGG